MWEEITYTFSSFNGCTVEVWEWIGYVIPHLIMGLITHLCWDTSQTMLVNGTARVLQGNWRVYSFPPLVVCICISELGHHCFLKGICTDKSNWQYVIIESENSLVPHRRTDDCVVYSLRWRHNGHNSVSNHQPHDGLLNRLFRRRSKKTSKLRVTGLCAGNSPTGEFHAKMASYAENVSIWWRYHMTHISATWLDVLTCRSVFLDRHVPKTHSAPTQAKCRAQCSLFVTWNDNHVVLTCYIGKPNNSFAFFMDILYANLKNMPKFGCQKSPHHGGWLLCNFNIKIVYSIKETT